MSRLLVMLYLTLAGCGGAEPPPAKDGSSQDRSAYESWFAWHQRKETDDLAIGEAFDQHDYVKAIALLNATDRPEPIKRKQMGMMIIQAFEDPEGRRTKETLEQAVQMIEDSAVQSGETHETAPQHLRILFERGAGRAPNAIPIDKPVADCWHKLENKGAGDPRRCIALRRQRLPRLGA